MSATTEPRAQEGTALVVFGLDGAGKPRASAFHQADAERAERVAHSHSHLDAVMGLPPASSEAGWLSLRVMV